MKTFFTKQLSLMSRFFSLVAGVLASITTIAQDFNYTVSTDSVAWQELNTQTILNADNSAWRFSYKIPIGFAFNYLGRNFDSLTIETNGYLVFDNDRNYAFTAFNGFGDNIDSSGNHSVLGYELSGTTGNHVLKIQFKHVSEMAAVKTLSYQVWLKENKDIEVHFGPNDFRFQQVAAVSPIDSSFTCRIGLINMNMSTPTRGYFIGGYASNPQGQSTDDNNPDPVFVTIAPQQGVRYTFSPSGN